LQLHTQSFTPRTCPKFTVKGKTPGLQSRDIHATVNTRHPFREEDFVPTPDRSNHQTVGHTNRLTNGILESGGGLNTIDKPIDYDLDRMILPPIQSRSVFKVHDRSVNPGSDVTIPKVFLEQLSELAFPLSNNRSENGDPATFRESRDSIDDGFDGLSRNESVTTGTMGHSNSREKNTEIVVNLGYGSDG
jgi:hypothetical protein